MKIKLISSIFVVALLTLWSPFISEAEAASVPFTTGDGEWDSGYTSSSSTPDNVDVVITDWGSQDWLKVRLCSASSGNCTGFKTIKNTPYGNSATFTNMAPGTYYGDVQKIHNPGNQVSGMIGFNIY